MKNEELLNLRMEVEKENKKREKKSKLKSIEKEIEFEKGIINIINNADETLRMFDNMVYNKRFKDALQKIGDKEEISVDISFKKYSNNEMRIVFFEQYGSKYEYKYKYKQLINCTTRVCDMCMIKRRLRHEMNYYYTVDIKNAFYPTETKKERLITESFRETLEVYKEELLKDITNLKKEINEKEETIEEFKEIKKEFETLYKKNREFQKKHDLTVLTLFDCDYDFYDSRNKWR